MVKIVISLPENLLEKVDEEAQWYNTRNNCVIAILNSYFQEKKGLIKND